MNVDKSSLLMGLDLCVYFSQFLVKYYRKCYNITKHMFGSVRCYFYTYICDWGRLCGEGS